MTIFTCFILSIAGTFLLADAFHFEDLSIDDELLYLQSLQKQLENYRHV